MVRGGEASHRATELVGARRGRCGSGPGWRPRHRDCGAKRRAKNGEGTRTNAGGAAGSDTNSNTASSSEDHRDGGDPGRPGQLRGPHVAFAPRLSIPLQDTRSVGAAGLNAGGEQTTDECRERDLPPIDRGVRMTTGGSRHHARVTRSCPAHGGAGRRGARGRRRQPRAPRRPCRAGRRARSGPAVGGHPPATLQSQAQAGNCRSPTYTLESSARRGTDTSANSLRP